MFSTGAMKSCFSKIRDCRLAGVLLQKQPPEVFCKEGILNNFGNFKGKHLRWSLFL